MAWVARIGVASLTVQCLHGLFQWRPAQPAMAPPAPVAVVVVDIAPQGPSITLAHPRCRRLRRQAPAAEQVLEARWDLPG
eukprot:10108260-Heterocapsa_arctica.AAC.1